MEFLGSIKLKSLGSMDHPESDRFRCGLDKAGLGKVSSVLNRLFAGAKNHLRIEVLV